MSNPTITCANESKITELLLQTQSRWLYMAPALTEGIADAIAHLWQTLGPESGSVILDVDPEVYRLGYGTARGLETLEQAARKNGTPICRHQEGVRIGLVISDQNTLIFTPTPLLIEAGSSAPNHPNAIELSSLPDEVARDIGLGPEGALNQTVGLDHVDHDALENTQADLERNPPVKFDVARKVRVFNSQLEFVELEMKGCAFSKRKAKIPPELMGFAGSSDLENNLEASYKLLEKTDLSEEGELWTEATITRKRKEIENNYLRNIKGFGKVIRRDLKEDFQREARELQQAIDEYKIQITDKISDVIEHNVRALTESFFEAVKSNVPRKWEGSLGKNPSDEELKSFLKDKFSQSFGRPAQYAQGMSLKLLFKGVTYEMLSDEEFFTLASKQFPQLRLLEEFDAAKEIYG